MPLEHLLPPREAMPGVRRALPHRACRKVGPWVFLDHLGPVAQRAGEGFDVPPHPHTALSTVTWLLQGAVEHRDSTGGHAIVRPGTLAWMRAGRGITHSERTPAPDRGRERALHGLQLWCAHPDGQEDQEPGFATWTDLPRLDVGGVPVDLVAGHGWGVVSPADVTSPLVLAIAWLRDGQTLALPDHAERCVYTLQGDVGLDGERVPAHHAAVVSAGAARLRASGEAVVAVLGGDPISPRFMWWNLIHSDPDELRRQALRYQRGEFPPVIGDDAPFLPAPPPPP